MRFRASRPACAGLDTRGRQLDELPNPASDGLCHRGDSTRSRAAAADDGADIHPGVMTFTEGAQCTSNFVFRDGGGTYLGQAAHCSGTGAATDTNGCDAGSLPLGTPVEIDGATRPGTLVYSSWIAMQAATSRTRTPAPTTTSRSSRSIRPTWPQSIRRFRDLAARPRSAARARCSATPSSPTATLRFGRASCSSARSRASSSRATAAAGAEPSTP